MFIIFVRSSMPQYMDDLKLIRVIRDGNYVELLQSDMNAILAWCQQYDMSLNLDKCSLMLFGNADVNIKANGFHLPRTTNTTDLGTKYDKRGKFDDQVNYAVRLGNYRIFEFQQKFRSRTPKVVRRYHLLKIRPVLEYNMAVWVLCANII
eukprot:GHVN01026496.1.p1 GENE.GHVN01026496.1~~GHVN01026496.1.p1  ORF type:complete len:150 (-),score=3.42 GHVN01026496.1:212-661(-)